MLLFLCLFGLALGDVAPSADDQVDHSDPLLQVDCPDLWIKFNQNCYKYVATPLTWVDAELHCVSEGANLVSIHNLQQHLFVKALIKNSNINQERTWIGLSDVHKEGAWMWSDGSPTNYFLWSEEQPDNKLNKEHCGQTNYDFKKKWNDAPCANLYGFVCVSRALY